MLGSIRNLHQQTAALKRARIFSIDWLGPVRQWLNGLEIRNAAVAHFVCRVIPVQCPFEQTITLFGHKIIHIPPLCKLNPLYEEVSCLRFRALCYLADECGEDIQVPQLRTRRINV